MGSWLLLVSLSIHQSLEFNQIVRNIWYIWYATRRGWRGLHALCGLCRCCSALRLINAVCTVCVQCSASMQWEWDKYSILSRLSPPSSTHTNDMALDTSNQFAFGEPSQLYHSALTNC